MICFVSVTILIKMYVQYVYYTHSQSLAQFAGFFFLSLTQYFYYCYN